MKHEDADRPVSDAPTYDDRWWFSVAVIAFIFTAAAFAFAAYQTFSDEGQDAVFRAQAFTPFGVALIAAVTFFTAVWRGVLSTQQIKLQSDQLVHQAEQLRQLVRQNDAKDDEALAKLLQEGAKFITEEQREAQVMAGIASLGAVIASDRKDRYAPQAIDIIASYYCKSYSSDALTVRNARHVLIRASHRNLKSSVAGIFETDEPEHSWPVVKGLAYQRYRGGSVDHATFNSIQGETQSFDDVRFDYVKRISGARFSDCSFRRCSIADFDVDHIYKNNFNSCDFSGCTFDKHYPISHIDEFDLREGDNFFFSDNPPLFRDFQDWESILNCRVRPQVDLENPADTLV